MAFPGSNEDVDFALWLDGGGDPLPPTGIDLSYVVPMGLGGLTVRLQFFAVHPLAANGTYAASAAHDIVF